MNLLANEKIYEYGGLLAAGYSIYQAGKIHSTELEKARERHKEAMRLAVEQHQKNITEEKRTFLLELFNNLEQHFQQLNADLIASGKESERDMFDQRNQSLQTIILAASVMFTGLCTAITNSHLPLPTPQVIAICFSVSTSCAFLCLFTCIVICIELIIRASNFMYRRARKHAENLQQAIRETKDMMSKLYGSTAESLSDGENTPVEGLKRSETESSTRRRRGIVDMNTEALEREWTEHERNIQRFMENRENINSQTAVVDHFKDANKASDMSKISFSEFWRESCKRWASLAIVFFYLGTFSLLMNIIVYMWAQFTQTYKNLPSALIAVLLIGASVIIALALAIVLRAHSAFSLVGDSGRMTGITGGSVRGSMGGSSVAGDEMMLEGGSRGGEGVGTGGMRALPRGVRVGEVFAESKYIV